MRGRGLGADIAITFEPENPDAPREEQIGVQGERHVACVGPTQIVWRVVSLRYIEAHKDPTQAEWYGAQCWGCGGWLNEPPLSAEQAVPLRWSREKEE